MIPREPLSKGTILNVSSITGHQAPLKDFYEVSYHTAKVTLPQGVHAISLTGQAGVEGFTNVLRHETLGTNIRILVHRPGTVRTEFHSRRLGYDDAKTAAMFEGIRALDAEDIAVGVLWQCLQPERVSVVLMETLPTSQRSLYAMDTEWESRNSLEGR
jgi:3-hydroxy acid dehydrogenase / malonic semialdehyde reductase